MVLSEHSPEYLAHLKSAVWKEKRRDALLRAKYACERCKTPYSVSTRLEVHHLTYERLGAERLTDLLVVCPPCHIKEDKKRKQRVETERVARHWNARLDGWATKVYGENWAYSQSAHMVEEEFEEWLEGRGDE